MLNCRNYINVLDEDLQVDPCPHLYAFFPRINSLMCRKGPADVIKLAFSWRDYCELSRWVQFNYESFKKKVEERIRGTRWCRHEPLSLPLKLEKEGHEPSALSASEAGTWSQLAAHCEMVTSVLQGEAAEFCQQLTVQGNDPR